MNFRNKRIKKIGGVLLQIVIILEFSDTITVQTDQNRTNRGFHVII